MVCKTNDAPLQQLNLYAPVKLFKNSSSDISRSEKGLRI